jgi:hypothetical protein
MSIATTLDLERAQDHATRIALEEAISRKWEDRAWYRGMARHLFGRRWDDLAAANDRELRRLVRHLRRVRESPETREEREHATHEGEPDCGLCMQAQDFYARYPA